MAWNNADEIVVAKGGQVSVAALGTALPTKIGDALNAAFVGLGFIDEDGATVSADPEIKEIAAWQARQPVRRELTAQEVQAQFKLLQWNENTVPFAFGGGVITQTSGGGYRYDFPEDESALDERSMVIDWRDGAEKHRLVLPRGNVTESVETQLQRSEASLLPITFKALEPVTGGAAAYYLTDSAAFAAGS